MDRDNTRNSASRAPVNYIIDRSAELLTASTLYVMGLRNPAIHWNGRLTGVSYMTIARSRAVDIDRGGHTALLSNGGYAHVDSDGEFTFAQLTLEPYAQMRFPTDATSPMGMVCVLGQLLMKFGSTISADFTASCRRTLTWSRARL